MSCPASPTTLERIKREIPIRELVEAAGVELKRHGQDYRGLCPLHEDREPSLVVSPEKNLWHCLGACQFTVTLYHLHDFRSEERTEKSEIANCHRNLASSRGGRGGKVWSHPSANARGGFS